MFVVGPEEREPHREANIEDPKNVPGVLDVFYWAPTRSSR
jgi:hypothetical protein